MTTFVPRRDYSSALEQARRDLRSYESVRGDGQHPKWSEWASTELPELMQSREKMVALLNDTDATLRLTACSLAAEYWPGSAQIAREVLRLAFDDPDAAVRGAALKALSRNSGHVSDPTDFIENLLRELFPGRREFLNYAQSAVEQVRTAKRQLWEELGGVHTPRMLESRAAAESYLEHHDANLRTAAIFILKDHWKPDEWFTRMCERIAFQDSDLKVRKLALSTLACCFSNTDDPRIGKLLASLVNDASIPQELCLTAYRSLFTIRPMPTDGVIAVGSASFRFPADVDWKFVDSFFRDK
jgi:hypothetical protein